MQGNCIAALVLLLYNTKCSYLQKCRTPKATYRLNTSCYRCHGLFPRQRLPWCPAISEVTEGSLQCIQSEWAPVQLGIPPRGGGGGGRVGVSPGSQSPAAPLGPEESRTVRGHFGLVIIYSIVALPAR